MAKYKCWCGANAESPDGCFKHKNRKPLAKTGGFKNSGKKLRRKKKSKEEIEEDRKELEKQWNFFLEIWAERPHYSEVSNTWLGEEPLSIFFDHLLEKSTYKHLKYEKENIALVTLEEHGQKGNGHPLPNHQKLIDKAKERFGIL